MKHFKNSQQIKYSTDHGSSYADREKISKFFFFLHISQMLNVSTFGNTADFYYAIVHLVHTRVSISRSTRATAAVIRLRRSRRLAGSGGTKTVSFTNPHKKKSHGVKSGDRGGHRVIFLSCAYSRTQNDCSSFLNAIFATTIS